MPQPAKRTLDLADPSTHPVVPLATQLSGGLRPGNCDPACYAGRPPLGAKAKGGYTRKSEQERLLEVEQKIEQLRAKKQQLEAKVKEKERKERTPRLIQIGAIFEKWCGLQSVEEAEVIAKAISEQGKQWREAQNPPSRGGEH